MIGLLQNGETIDSLIANCFPDLTRAQVYECLAYYEDHRGVNFLPDNDVPEELSYLLEHPVDASLKSVHQ